MYFPKGEEKVVNVSTRVHILVLYFPKGEEKVVNVSTRVHIILPQRRRESS